MPGTERCWQVLRRLGQTFLHTAFPALMPKSLPNYMPCPCLSLVFKHPGLLMRQINSGEQLEQLPLAEGRSQNFPALPVMVRPHNLVIRCHLRMVIRVLSRQEGAQTQVFPPPQIFTHCSRRGSVLSKRWGRGRKG